MKAFSLKLGIVVAGFTLATASAFAQKPGEGGGGGPAAGAVDRASGGGAPSGGGAVDRGSGGGSGGGSVSSSDGGSTGSGGGGSTFSSPSGSAGSSPSMSFGSVREFAPQHRAGFSSGIAYSEDGQTATPRSSGPSGGGGSGGAVSRGSGSSSSGSSGSSGSGGTSSGTGSAGAGTRSGSGSADSPGARTTGRTRTGPAPEANAGATNNASGASEVPSWSRPRGDRPASGTAVDRTTPVPDRNGNNRGRGGYGDGYYDPYGYYGNGYGYGSPYSNYYGYYPYGMGMGYGLYSGYGWAPYFGDASGDPYGGGYGSGGGYATSYGRGEQGNLKLKVKPRAAKVFVDGYFVGYVDQFDGSFQKLALNTGRHKVEIKADGFETAEFDVLINPQQTVTFQGDLKRIQ